MALRITDPEIEQEVRDLALERGQTVTEVIGTAVRGFRINDVRSPHPKPGAEEIMKLVRSFNLQPINEDLTEDEILGYGPDGIPQ